MNQSAPTGSASVSETSGTHASVEASSFQMEDVGSGRPHGAALLAFYVGYMLAAAFGQWMLVIPEISITVWPPNGVVLAMLLTQPARTWAWWVALGAAGELTGNVIWFHNPLHWALGYIVANATAVLAAAFVLTPWFRSPIRRVTSLTQVLAFFSIAVLLAPVISATIGSAVDALAGKNPFSTTWPLWWLGDATGILIATPLVISAINVWREEARPTPMQIVEGLAIALVLVGLTAWELQTNESHAFLLPLPVLWAALRFEFRGATLAVLGLAVAIGFHTQAIDTDLMSPERAAQLHTRLQALIVAAASTGLIVAAIIRQQRQAALELARANVELESRVADRTRAIEAAEERFRATFQNAGVGISIVRGDGTLMEVNDSLARMLDYAPGELEGLPLDRFTHPDDRALGDAAWDRLKTGEADDYELEKRYLRKDGSVVWGHTTVSCVRQGNGQIAYLIKIIQDISARKRSDEARQLLMHEVNHRSKNLLTIVQVIARQTAARSPQDFVRTFDARLRAMAANQDLLVRSEWQRVGLDELVRSQLEHFGDIDRRIVLSGTPLMVPPAVAQALGMALHELATNAAKYGSLSNATGKVHVSWVLGPEEFRMSWRETGGPKVTPPENTGFGTTVLDRMTASTLSGTVTMDYAADGFVWELTCPRSAVEQCEKSSEQT